MNTKDKLIFCGNSSIDHIITHQDTKDVIGGSAVYSAIAGSLLDGKEVSIISSIGYDFPLDILDNLKIDTKYVQRYNCKTNSFAIDERHNRVFLRSGSYLPIQIPDNIHANHLHVSCRKGVPFIEVINKIKAQHYSFDVMWSSVKDYLPELSECLKKADFLFCNNDEYKIMKQNGLIDSLPQDLTIFTTDKHGVSYQKGKEQKYFPTIKTDNVVSTVGAGDTFIGGFLSSFNGNNLNESIYHALAMASLSINDFGNIHLTGKYTEINETKKTIQRMDKNNETQFNIYNRSILQR